MPAWKKVITSGSDASLNTLLITDSAVLSGSVNTSGSWSHCGDFDITIPSSTGQCVTIGNGPTNRHFCYDPSNGRTSAYLISSQNFSTGADGRTTLNGCFLQIQGNAYINAYQNMFCINKQYPSSGGSTTLRITNCNSVTAPDSDHKLIEFDNCSNTVGYVTVSGSAFFSGSTTTKELIVTGSSPTITIGTDDNSVGVLQFSNNNNVGLKIAQNSSLSGTTQVCFANGYSNRFNIGSNAYWALESAKTTFNYGSYDHDIQFNGDNQLNLLYVNAGDDRVGICTNSPSASLHVEGDLLITDSAVLSGSVTVSGSTELRGSTQAEKLTVGTSNACQSTVNILQTCNYGLTLEGNSLSASEYALYVKDCLGNAKIIVRNNGCVGLPGHANYFGNSYITSDSCVLAQPVFSVNDCNGNSIIDARGSRRVGIGIVGTPQTSLHVEGTVSASCATIADDLTVIDDVRICGSSKIGLDSNYQCQSTQYTTQYSCTATETGFIANRSGCCISMVMSSANVGQIKTTTNSTRIEIAPSGSTTMVLNGTCKHVSIGYGINDLIPSTLSVCGDSSFRVNSAACSLAIGDEVGNASTTGVGNTLIGYRAGCSITTGYNHTLIGPWAGRLVTTGLFSTMIGHQAGYCSCGNQNTFIGDRAGYSNTSNGQNVAIGTLASYTGNVACEVGIGHYAFGQANTTRGNSGIAIGVSAGRTAHCSDDSIMIGRNAGYSISGSGVVAIGYAAGYSGNGSYAVNIGYQAGQCSTGGSNINVGYLAGQCTAGQNNVNVGVATGYNITGDTNIFIGLCTATAGIGAAACNIGIGMLALSKLETAAYNVAIGRQSLFNATSGGYNISIGYVSGCSITTGNNNILMGGNGITTGTYNVAIGSSTMLAYSNANSIIAIGWSALRCATSGIGNTAIGVGSQQYSSTGGYNVSLGNSSLANVKTCFNTAIGFAAGASNSVGSSNFYGGSYAGCSNTSGSGNVVIGTDAGRNMSGTPSNNVVIGCRAGCVLQCSDNVMIGRLAGLSACTAASSVFIGSCAGFYASGSNSNVYIGSNAGRDNRGGIRNISIGGDAGLVTCFSDNINIGNSAGRLAHCAASSIHIGYCSNGAAGACGGIGNVTIGDKSGLKNRGGYNVYIGLFSGAYTNISPACRNTVVGTCSMFSIISGSNNTAHGGFALYCNNNGNNNVAIGYSAGYCATGDANVFLGYLAGRNCTSNNNTLIIGNSCTSELIYGEFDNEYVKTNAELAVRDDLIVSGSVVSYLHKNEQTAGYTLALSDLGKMVEVSSSSAVEIIIPTNASVAFPTGSQLMVARYGPGAVTLATGSGVTIRSVGGALNINSQYGAATLIKRQTDEWYAFGDISAS